MSESEEGSCHARAAQSLPKIFLKTLKNPPFFFSLSSPFFLVFELSAALPAAFGSVGGAAVTRGLSVSPASLTLLADGVSGLTESDSAAFGSGEGAGFSVSSVAAAFADLRISAFSRPGAGSFFFNSGATISGATTDSGAGVIEVDSEGFAVSSVAMLLAVGDSGSGVELTCTGEETRALGKKITENAEIASAPSTRITPRIDHNLFLAWADSTG